MRLIDCQICTDSHLVRLRVSFLGYTLTYFQFILFTDLQSEFASMDMPLNLSTRGSHYFVHHWYPFSMLLKETKKFTKIQAAFLLRPCTFSTFNKLYMMSKLLCRWARLSSITWYGRWTKKPKNVDFASLRNDQGTLWRVLRWLRFIMKAKKLTCVEYVTRFNKLLRLWEFPPIPRIFHGWGPVIL